MTREARVAHNHTFQAASVPDSFVYVEGGCTACRLIRPEVMSREAVFAVKAGFIGTRVPTPEEV